MKLNKIIISLLVLFITAYFNGVSARYISSDPIGLAGGMNTYAYVGGNPVNYTDPSGLCFGPLAIVCGVVLENAVAINTAGIVASEVAAGVSIVGGGAVVANKAVQAVEQYSLRAAASGWYPVMTRGSKKATAITWCEAGDAWKFGTTKNPSNRYSYPYLKSIGQYGVEYVREFKGTLDEALTLENMKIRNYLDQTGDLPPGNKIIR